VCVEIVGDGGDGVAERDARRGVLQIAVSPEASEFNDYDLNIGSQVEFYLMG